MKKIAIAVAVLLAGCNAQPPSDTGTSQAAPEAVQAADGQSAAPGYNPPPVQPVVSMYVQPPEAQPAPVSVEWAPPPMLVDTPPPQPSDDQVWTGGYWVWEGNWIWARGQWAPPPHHGYHWNNPYYDHRGNNVVFVNGFWAAPGVTFVAPPLDVSIAVGIIGIGVIAGTRANGPEGVFVPAPPGSYYGLIVPAPMGTPPAVVVGSAPVIRSGMHITVNNQSNVSNTTNVTNITNINNVTNVTIVAPASAMADGRAVKQTVPALPHLAAAQASPVVARAPEPPSRQPVPAYIAGHKPMSLPAPQAVHAEVAAPLLQRPVPAKSALPFAGEPQRAAGHEDEHVRVAPPAQAHQPESRTAPQPAIVREVPPIPAEKAARSEPAHPPEHPAAAPKQAEPRPKAEPKPQPELRPEPKAEPKVENRSEAEHAKKPEKKPPEKPEHD